jgi:hypothetical protein
MLRVVIEDTPLIKILTLFLEFKTQALEHPLLNFLWFFYNPKPKVPLDFTWVFLESYLTPFLDVCL